MSLSTKPTASPRPWYLDAVCAFAFFLLAAIVGKSASRALGPIVGLFCFTICGGLAWYFARCARRGFLALRP